MRLFVFLKKLLNKSFLLLKLKRNLSSKKISQIDFNNGLDFIGNHNEDLDKSNKNVDNEIDENKNFKSNKSINKKQRKTRVKSFISFVICLLALFFILFSPLYILNKKNYNLNLSDLLLDKSSNANVLTLWHVETFEGGGANRGKFLENQAISFNKKQKECFIIIKTLNEKQLFFNLEQNTYPDIFSFGVGAGYMISSLLANLSDNENIRDDLQQYGKINGQVLAYPYMLGGYVAITRENDFNNDNLQENFTSINSNNKNKQKLGFGLSSGDFTFGLQAVNLNNGLKLNRKDMLEFDNSYNAYTGFLQNKFKTLIGTTRDFARCKNRESNGSIETCVYSYLQGFSDLVQYVGINKNISSQKISLSIKFLNYLLEDSAQKSIANYGLFSATNKKIYSDECYSDFEDKLLENITSINVFSSLKEIENNKQTVMAKLLN